MTGHFILFQAGEEATTTEFVPFNFIDILIITGLILFLAVFLFFMITKFYPWVSKTVDKMAIYSFVKRKKIKTRGELIDFYWSKHKKTPTNEYVLSAALDAYDRFIEPTEGS